MKRYTMNMTLAVAALAIAAGTLSAQTMKAEIPFAFRVGGQLLQPGTYRVNLNRSGGGGVQLLSVSSYEQKRTVMAMPTNSNSASKEWLMAGTPKLRFACGEGACALMRVWTGEGQAADLHINRGKDGEMHIAEITMRPDRAN
jgi:hypothetical protein